MLALFWHTGLRYNKDSFTQPNQLTNLINLHNVIHLHNLINLHSQKEKDHVWAKFCYRNVGKPPRAVLCHHTLCRHLLQARLDFHDSVPLLEIRTLLLLSLHRCSSRALSGANRRSYNAKAPPAAKQVVLLRSDLCAGSRPVNQPVASPARRKWLYCD